MTVPSLDLPLRVSGRSAAVAVFEARTANDRKQREATSASLHF
jgi:hypothetical protein